MATRPTPGTPRRRRRSECRSVMKAHPAMARLTIMVVVALVFGTLIALRDIGLAILMVCFIAFLVGITLWAISDIIYHAIVG